MKRKDLPHLAVILTKMDVFIQLYSVKNSPKLNDDGIKTKKNGFLTYYLGSGCYLEMLSFRFARKSVKIGGKTRLRVLNLLNQEIVFVRFWCRLYLIYLCTVFNDFIVCYNL